MFRPVELMSLYNEVMRKDNILFVSETPFGCCLAIWSMFIWQQVKGANNCE